MIRGSMVANVLKCPMIRPGAVGASTPKPVRLKTPVLNPCLEISPAMMYVLSWTALVTMSFMARDPEGRKKMDPL